MIVKPLAVINIVLASQLFILKQAQAQEFFGHVMDSISMSPLPYVNVGIVGKNIGTVSDAKGYFKITIDSTHNSDTLRFSLIGYNSKAYGVGSYRKLRSIEQSKIYLNVRPTLLDEVTIRSKTSSPLILGTKPNSKLVNVGFINNNLGHEVGSLFKVSAGELLIDSVGLNIVKCNYENVYLRLNVYEVQDDRMENILTTPIYVSLTKQQALQNPVIDLTRQSILVDHDFIISVELVTDLGEKGLYFYANINDKTNPGMYRLTSQGLWTRMEHKSKPVGISILAYVH